MLATLSLIGGFAILIKGADWLVDGATALARQFHVLGLFLCLPIVAFGTSMPELVVNIIASFRGSTEIAIGNILGSNIANILLILGIAATIRELAVHRSTVIKEIPFSLLAAAVLFIMANDRIIDGYAIAELGRGDGLAFIGFFLIFLYYTFSIAKGDDAAEKTTATRTIPVAVGMIIGGLLALILGGKLGVDGAVEIARMIGISEALIGLTVVAVGTSLPELATSAVAAYRGSTDIAVGNIVGSNIFNVFWILGISAIIRPLPFVPALNFDLGIVVLSTLLLFFTIHNGHMYRRLLLWWRQTDDYVIRRWEGALLLLAYVAYVAYIVVREVG
jgi:cation:H+ antiporter